jgi:Cof subfamily protein (haloacid dehalogenase superfamily)
MTSQAKSAQTSTAPAKPVAKSKAIRLVIADVDGTLVKQDKSLTRGAVQAVGRLRDAGITFAITSGRPPRGMAMLIKPLSLTTPIPGFNGGMFANPDLSIIEQHTLPTNVTLRIISTLQDHNLTVWLYRGQDWFVLDKKSPHVAREERTVQFAPTVVPSFDALLDGVVKAVGVSDDLGAVARCETDTHKIFAQQVSAARSQPYYLDVTHPSANKGTVVKWMSDHVHVETDQIATIGDQPNDVLMFAQSGLSIAMGNASKDVQQDATHVTQSNEQEGFAAAVEQFILPTSGRKGVNN